MAKVCVCVWSKCVLVKCVCWSSVCVGVKCVGPSECVGQVCGGPSVCGGQVCGGPSIYYMCGPSEIRISQNLGFPHIFLIFEVNS